MDTETPPAVGDVVCLKSGGPAMTVSFRDGQKVTCCWFDGCELRAEGFAPQTLRDAKPKSAADRPLTLDQS